MRQLAFGVAMLILLGSTLSAQEEKGKPKPDSPAEKFKSYTEDFQRLRAETGKIFQEAKTDAEKKKIFEGYQTKMSALAGQLLGLAQAHPADPVAVDALMMAIGIGSDADKEKATGLLRTTAEKSSDKAVQGHAAFALADHLKERLDDPALKPEGAAKLSKEAEEYFDRAAKLLAGSTDAKAKELRAMAEKNLFELRNLLIGKKAPDIEGVDSDGKKFKLSDYVGKVVVLDFWAEW